MSKQLFLISLVLITACSADKEKKPGNLNILSSPVEIILESGNNHFKSGDTIVLSVTHKKISSASNVQLFLNDSLIAETKNFPFKFSLTTGHLAMGHQKLKVSVLNEGKTENKSITITIFPKKKADNYKFHVVHVFPHDTTAYTQGLFYQDGYLYEGTGQKGQSSLRKIDLNTGKVLQNHKLEEHIFGEGISLLGNRIYQLSWNDETGFIYNADDFQETGRFYYRGEGWGLTTDGSLLIKSNGSNRISFHNPDNFSEVKYIEVYSDKAAVDQLNELEFIDGKIYANIWQKDQIAIINPVNGALEGLISLNGLLPKKDRTRKTDVLNGIAYDAENKRLYVTGKNWPNVFEIKIENISGD